MEEEELTKREKIKGYDDDENEEETRKRDDELDHCIPLIGRFSPFCLQRELTLMHPRYSKQWCKLSTCFSRA
jgi:hypothetical protein